MPLFFDWLSTGLYINLVRSVAYGHEKTVKQAAKLLGIKDKLNALSGISGCAAPL